jgi:RNA polymerase-binding transcription factor DksA
MPVATRYRLTATDREGLRQRLEERARALRDEIGAEIATKVETEVDLAEVKRDEDDLEEVERALARIDTPGYGTCADCGEPIAWARLHALPAASRCHDCQERAEA